MSLNKKTMVREIGRRTRLSNRDVQAVIETLIDVWTEELVADGRIEIENFMVLSCREKSRTEVLDNGEIFTATIRKICVTTSKRVQMMLQK